jgi:catechol 2,3-dioxygenase-like lactoylglutathione lyase family enzyme
MKLEVVVVPVADVDRAKDFYKGLGWREDADFVGDASFRIVQLTPPGSAASIQLGVGVTAAAPGSLRGILGRPREANYEAVPRVTFCDPQAASVGDADGPFTATVALADIARTSTYTRAYDTRPGFLTLVSDGDRLTGAYALGPEAGEWLQQVTLAIRARTPLAVLLDVIQPFPTFSEAVFQALRTLNPQLDRTGMRATAAPAR